MAQYVSAWIDRCRHLALSKKAIEKERVACAVKHQYPLFGVNDFAKVIENSQVARILGSNPCRSWISVVGTERRQRKILLMHPLAHLRAIEILKPPTHRLFAHFRCRQVGFGLPRFDECLKPVPLTIVLSPIDQVVIGWAAWGLLVPIDCIDL